MSIATTVRGRALVTALAGLLVATAFSLLGPAAPARAAGPVSLAPSGGQVVDGLPTLTWQRITGVSRYDVQLATDSTFGTRLVDTNTVNSSFVPQVPLPGSQDLWWRVRASGSGDAGWSSATFRTSTLPVPTITSLAADPNSELAQPSNPLDITWTRVAGASSYTVQLSTQPGFNDASLRTEATVRATSWAPTDPQIANKTFYSRVRANFDGNLQSNWSSTRNYQLGALSDAALVSPAFQQTVTDVALDWKPVPGAVRYEIQVDANQSFGSGAIGATVVGTRWSPAHELANRSYYWRVRGLDANGNGKDWATVPVWQFTRGWDGQPAPEYPGVDTAVASDPDPDHHLVVGDPFYYQWKPSELTSQGEDLSLASSYLLQVSTDPTFQTSLRQCVTTQTTYVPQTSDDCFPAARGTYYWRVIGQDDFSQIGNPTAATSAIVFRFTYRPDQVQTIAPAEDEPVTIPTLQWRPVDGAAQYRITIRNADTSQVVARQDTAATSFTPRGILPAATYEWQVQTISRDGRLGIEYVNGWPKFVVNDQPAATASSLGGLNTPAGIRFPTLTWTPMANAVRYEIWARPVGSDAYTQIDNNFAYPAGQDVTERFLTPGDYDWFVKAYNSSGGAIATSATSRFTIRPLETYPAANVYAALSGTQLPADAGTAVAGSNFCSTELTSQGKCTNLRNSPVLTWPRQPNVGYYKLYVAYDKAMTNGVYGNADGAARPLFLSQAMWAPVNALADNQANTAYYVRIASCSYGGACEKLLPADNAFDKLSRPVLLNTPQTAVLNGSDDARGTLVDCVTPTAGAPVACANDVTLSWQDLRNSETTALNAGSVPGRDFDSDTPIQDPGRTEARSYQVQVALDPGFQRLVDNTEVDQTTYTSPGTLFPEGQLYWRVRAIDANANTLPWSEPGTFTKRSPAPTLIGPVSASAVPTAVPGDTTLSWSSLPFASQYHLEVYSGGDTTASGAHRILDVTTRSRVWTLTNPLRVADGPYVWRVQPIDVSGNSGTWSENWDDLNQRNVPVQGRFVVATSNPTLTSPAPAAESVAPSDTVFSWSAVTGATNYRWELLSSGGTVVDAVVTAALAWAPVNPIGGGSWSWRVTANDANGNALGSSIQSFSVINTVSATTAPVINGSGRVGEPITMTAPTWNLPSVQTTYQWLRDGGEIGSQTGTTYVVTDADRGHTISVRATGARDGYMSGQSTSNGIAGLNGNAPVPTTAVRISGSGKVGTLITSTDPVWDASTVVSSYQWQRDGSDIGGATGPTYTVTPDDVAKSLTLKVTGRRTGYSDGSSTSNVVVALLGDAAVASTPVSISGPNTRTGTTWTSSPPTWNDTQVTTSYQWWRDGAAIAGATGGSYRLTDADIGTSVTLRATGSRRGYQPGLSVSQGVGVSPLDPLATTSAPSVGGVPNVRETLTASPGTWQIGNPSFTYQWFVNGQAVARETGSTYVVRGRDAGLPVTVRVIATADGWAPGAATSAPVKIALMTSTTTANAATSTITQKQRAVLSVKVALADYGIDLGSVQVLDGKKVVATKALKSGGDGTASIRLKKLKKGKHKLSVVYTGNAYTQPSKAKPVKIIVTTR